MTTCLLLVIRNLWGNRAKVTLLVFFPTQKIRAQISMFAAQRVIGASTVRRLALGGGSLGATLGLLHVSSAGPSPVAEPKCKPIVCACAG